MRIKNSLGQNFIKDSQIVKKIVEAADLKLSDMVLEVGPGKGILTEELAKKAGKVVAVEIDKNLANILKNKFKNCKNIEIVNEDVLNLQIQISNFKFPIKSKTQNPNNIHNTLYVIPNTGYKVVANLPYYITSPIIRMFLESENPPSEMILMVQKEVAERIVAEKGKMSILAVSVQYYAKPELLFTVNKKSFYPVPEVDSAVIRIVTSNMGYVASDERKQFFRVVRAGFCAKRKTLANNLSNSFHLDKKEVEKKMEELGFASNVRAQELSVEDWKKLAKIF